MERFENRYNKGNNCIHIRMWGTGNSVLACIKRCLTWFKSLKLIHHIHVCLILIWQMLIYLLNLKMYTFILFVLIFNSALVFKENFFSTERVLVVFGGLVCWGLVSIHQIAFRQTSVPYEFGETPVQLHRTNLEKVNISCQFRHQDNFSS